ncbi:hypothetical protein HT749_15490 [Burkholderia cepacia]|uniref:hypothetical protein n=1 Tax=Burkholderia cepacia TaxID=292 RepID=UPI00157A6F57|nr:hypothetical protein [Burkholderia cepacia]NTX44809.1 hypothetical protein [Burkholderia cepacia]
MTRKTKYRLKQISAVAMAMLTVLEALPAFAQSDAERNVGLSNGQRPESVVTYVDDTDDQITSFVQAPVASTTQVDLPPSEQHFLGSVSSPIFDWMDNGQPWRNYIALNVASFHMNRGVRAANHYHEFNPGIGYERSNGDYGFAVGIYDNSMGIWSTYALGIVTPAHAVIGHGKNQITLSAGGAVGILTGYGSKSTSTEGYLTWKNINGYPTTVPATKEISTFHRRAITPALGGVLTAEWDDWRVRVFVVPSVHWMDVDGFAGLQFQRAF